MSVLFPLAGNPQPPDFLQQVTTSRSTVFSVATGEKAQTIISVGVINTDASNAVVVTLELFDGTSTYRYLWKGSVAANTSASITGAPVGLTVLPGYSVTAIADAGSRATVNINRVQQR